MRHIDDGYSYEFYAYERDVLDYYRRKSDYDIDESEREFRGMKIALLEDDSETTYSFDVF